VAIPRYPLRTGFITSQKRESHKLGPLILVVALGLALTRTIASGALTQPARSIAPPVAITRATIVDTDAGEEYQDQTVIVVGGRIAEVKDSAAATLPEGIKVIDGRNKFLIPGLWDMHVHGNNEPWFASLFPLYLANGVTGIREMFGPPNANEYRAALSTMNVAHPHVYLASPIIDGQPKVWPDSIEVTSPELARRVVDEQKRNGADFIKVYSLLSRETYVAIMDESKRVKIPVAGHVPRAVSVWTAAAAGQVTFEHLNGVVEACSSREEELSRKLATTRSATERNQLYLGLARSYDDAKCQRLFEVMRKGSIRGVPTLTVDRAFGHISDDQFMNDPRLRYFHGEFHDWLTAKDDFRLKDYTADDYALERQLLEEKQKLVGKMYKADVSILAGTDTGNPYCFPGFSLHDELALLVESGLTPMSALQAATRNAARLMGTTDRYGSIARGKVADLVMLDADPLADIHNTTKISAVFLEGREFDRGALDASLEAAASAR
jgi:imidazolonepropionase-like amidohydrolase